MQEECGTWDLICRAKRGLGDAAAGVANNALESMKNAVLEATEKALTSVTAGWVKFDVNLTSNDGGTTPSDAVGFIQDSLWWYMGAAAVLSVIVGGGKMAWDHRAEPGRELLKSLMTLVIVSGAGLTAIGLAVTAADEFSVWIIDRSTDGTDFGENILKVASLGEGLGALLIILLGLIAILVSFVQVMLLMARAGMLVILAGILPLTASFTNLEMGRDWFKTCIAWVIAWILYKPAAAIVYATAFRLIGTDATTPGEEDEDELIAVLVGLILMIMALFALPALMRFVTPAVGSMASGGGGGLGSMAMSALPMGAMAVGALKNASSGSSGSGGGNTAPAPTGSQATGPSTGTGSNGGPPSNGGQPASGTQATSAPVAGANGGGDQAGAKGGGSANGGVPAGSPTGPTSGSTTSTVAAAAGPPGAVVAAGTKAGEAGAKAASDTANDAASSEEGPRGNEQR